MDKREKVVGNLYILRTWCAVNPKYGMALSVEDCDKAVGWLDDAIEMLKEQEPMKPTRYQEGRWFKTWRCGACGGTLVFRNGEDKPKYCTDCGTAVKWE